MKLLICATIIFSSLCLYGQVKKSIEPKHEGVFLRSTLGLGFTSLIETVTDQYNNSDEMEITGFSYDMNIQAGYSVIENLQLYGVLGANIIAAPSFKFNGSTANNNVSSSVNLVRYGFGTAYYFVPENIYVSFDITSGRDEVNISNQSAQSQRGLIFNFGLGKEWWVAKNLAVGGMVYFFTGSIDDETFEGQTPKIRNTGGGVNFAVTFN